MEEWMQQLASRKWLKRGDGDLISRATILAYAALEVPASSPPCHVGQAARHWRLSAHDRIIVGGAD